MATLTLRPSKRGPVRVLKWVEHGRRMHRTLGLVSLVSERQAQSILKLKEAELTTGRKLLNDDKKAVRFDSHADNYLRWHKNEFPSSHFRIEQIVRMYLKPAFGPDSLSKIDLQSMEGYVQMRRESGAAVTTIGKEVRTMKAIMRKAVAWRVIDRSDALLVKEPKSMESAPHPRYTPQQLEKLYKVDPAYAAVWQLFVNTGMRRHEGLALKWSDISYTEINILSRAESRTKSAIWRPVELSAGAKEALRQLKSVSEESGKEQAWVLPRVAPESLSRRFIQKAKKAGIGGSLHWLRHTFTSVLVEKGVPLRTVQLILGHSSITVTEGYAHPALNSNKALRKLKL